MTRKLSMIFILALLIISAGCAGGTTTPYIPPDPPTTEELADLLGSWSGLSETSTGLLDQIDLTFYLDDTNLMVTIYLNNNYVDDVNAEYDGDRVRFSSYSLIGDFGEFDGLIDHDRLSYIGDFYIQVGISTNDGTFVIYKV